MSSLAGEYCDACLYSTEDVVKNEDDRLCASCRAVLWTAQVLFDHGISDVDKIVPTIAFAAEYGARWLDHPDEQLLSEELDRKYPHLELVGVESVPVLRERALYVRAVRHHGTLHVPERVQIKVFSRHAKGEDLAALYEQTLREENIPWHKSSSGSFEWEYDYKHLSIEIGRGGELSEYPGRPPRGALSSFPPPVAVECMCEVLLGSYYGSSLSGFRPALGEQESPHKPMTPEKAIPASAAWWLLRRSRDPNRKPAEDHRRVAGVLNRHLLVPCGQRELSETHSTPEDTVWRDAERLEIRLYSALDSLLNPPV